MHFLDDGYSIDYIHREYGIDHTLLKVLYSLYQAGGEASLKKKSTVKISAEQKLAAIRDFEDNGLPLDEIFYKYNVSSSAFNQWRKKYASGGIESLQSDVRGRPRKDMGRPKKYKEPRTDLERLQEENLGLKIELELLKKVNALVKEKENRLRELGRKPSKN